MAEQVMRMPEIGSSPETMTSRAPGAAVQRACSDCEEELQRKPGENTGRLPEDTLEMDRMDIGMVGGQPLPVGVRAFFEPRFAYDFSRVRIHTGSQADRAARSVNALAFTQGQNIVFRAGQFSPGSVKGKRLLAHELTHIIQQNGAPPGRPAFQVNSLALPRSSASTRISLQADHGIVQRQQGFQLREPRLGLQPPTFRLTSTAGRHFRVYFDQGIYLLPRLGELEKIEAAAQALLSNPSLDVIVEGHASGEGAGEENQRLSENRANSVKMLLIQQGISESRIHTLGRGEAEPAVQETATEPRALEAQRRQNRRVEIAVVSRLSRPESTTTQPVRLTLTDEELLRIISDPNRPLVQREVARALREIGPPDAGGPGALEDLAGRIKRHMELRAGDYVISPDLGTILGGLKDLLFP